MHHVEVLLILTLLFKHICRNLNDALDKCISNLKQSLTSFINISF